MTSEDDFKTIIRPDGAIIKVPARTEDEVTEDGKHSCGYELNSFACRIRHQALHTGAANMARQWQQDQARTEQVRKYGI